ncbi:MAG: response regulator transcription factor [Prochloraceae cyanobacterium]
MNTILIVEDGLTDTAIISSCLQKAGFFVVCVRSVEEAQQKLQQQNPDLIVLDVILPGQSGYELCRDLKSDPNTSRIPVVFCSTKNTRVDKMWGGMLGADAYLSKPVDREELLRTVQQFIKN